MDYALTCSCGRPLRIDAGAAGTEVACECGARIRVPNLSTLRMMVGRAAYGTGPANVTRRTLPEGSLPWGEVRAAEVSIAKVKVLLFAANPSGTDPLDLHREFREIDEEIRFGEFRDALELIIVPGTRVVDLLRKLNEGEVDP